MDTRYQMLIESTIEAALSHAKLPPLLSEPIAYALYSGGKRIRPLLTLASAEACGSTTEHAAPIAAAIEILHNFTLIHDDIMDHSPLRRGKPTVHIRWSEATAILAGDTMMGIAYQLLAERYTDAVCRHIVNEFSSAFVDICIGQAEDLSFRFRADVTMEDYLGMVSRKTARLFATAAVAGGMAANASASTIEALRRFGTALGIAFQIQDDMLDLFGEPAFGKERGHDLREGKKTFPILAAASLGAAIADFPMFTDYLQGKACTSNADVEALATLCRQCDVFTIARTHIDEQLRRATEAIEEAFSPTPARESLLAIVEQTRHRRI